MAEVKRERCKGCGFKVRSPGHEQGPHHNPVAIRTKGGKPIHKYGPMHPTDRPKTKPVSAGRGFDFDAVKRGGLPK